MSLSCIAIKKKEVRNGYGSEDGDDLRLEPRAKRMRDEPRGLKEYRRDNAVVYAERNGEGAFAREELCTHISTSHPNRNHTADTPGRGNTSTEAIHVAATAAAYS